MATIKVTDATFERDVLNADKPVLVDFWATWCAPCRQVAPILEELSTELEGSVVVAKVDVDANPAISAKLRIQSIPTFVLFHKGRPVGAMQGAQPKAGFVKFLEKYVPALKPPTVSVAELATELASGRAPTIIDIRDERDYTRAHLRGARCVQPEHLEEELRKLGSAARVVLVCRTGERSKAEAARLAELGLPVVSLEKGLLEWQGANKPTYSTREEQELEAQA